MQTYDEYAYAVHRKMREDYGISSFRLARETQTNVVLRMIETHYIAGDPSHDAAFMIINRIQAGR